MLSIQDIQLPLAGWTEIEPADRTRRWRNAAGDQLTLDFFGLVPDLPEGPETIRALRGFYRDALGGSGGIVEVEPTVVAGIRSAQAIFKIPQQPSGMTYLAAVTIPFRECSFVIKWQCPENGTTGMRDAVVFALVAPPLDDATGVPRGWAQDPYDPSHRSAALRNRADDTEWDARFPTHPLSRVRGYLRTLGDVRLSARAGSEPRFAHL